MCASNLPRFSFVQMSLEISPKTDSMASNNVTKPVHATFDNVSLGDLVPCLFLQHKLECIALQFLKHVVVGNEIC